MRGRFLLIVPSAFAHHAAQLYVWMGPTLLVLGLISRSWLVAALGAVIMMLGRFPLVRVQNLNRHAHYEEASIVIDELGIIRDGERAIKREDIRQAVILPDSTRPSVRVYDEDRLMAQLEIEVDSYAQALAMLRALGCAAEEKSASFETLVPSLVSRAKIFAVLPLLVTTPFLFRHVDWNHHVTVVIPILQSLVVMGVGLSPVHLPRVVTVQPDGIATTFFGRFRRFYPFSKVTKTTRRSFGGSFDFNDGRSLNFRAGGPYPVVEGRSGDPLVERAMDAYDAFCARTKARDPA